MSKRYPNLVSVGAMQASYGNFVKAIGILVGITGVIAALVISRNSLELAFVVLVVALLLALGIHALGTFLAAIGEAMLALADIATNSWGSLPSPANEPKVTKGTVGKSTPVASSMMTGTVDQGAAARSTPKASSMMPGTFELAGAVFCEKCRLAIIPGEGHTCQL